MAMHRRNFIAGLGGAAAAWPLAARAQQRGPMRRVGVLSAIPDENDPSWRARAAAFEQGLAKLGWTAGRNVHIDYRYNPGDAERARALAAELVALRPDVLLAAGTLEVVALRQATSSIPIVFTLVADPIGNGFIKSFARPGGNVTGFLTFEPPLAGKWVQLLQKTAPGLRRIAFLFHPAATWAGELFRYAQAAATPLMIEMIAAPVRNDAEVEEALASLAREPNGGLVVNGDPFTGTAEHIKLIDTLAVRYRLPAIWPFHYAESNLLSYGPDTVETFSQAAIYVDKIFHGEKAADLPVLAAVRFNLVINLKTAKAMGLDVPPDMLSIANEVIE